MIQIYTDGQLAYDSRLDDYSLKGLTYTHSLNKGGTAQIVMPPGHPAYDQFTSYKTVVEILRDGVLLFRGRALYPTDDFAGSRTVVCEGELCFFQDAVSRPYLYQADPASVLASVLEVYNSQVDESKRFGFGAVTVTDPNDYIRLESETAESVFDTINKLLERCGGYFLFSTAADGTRVLNWYKELGYRSSQVIEFGENLLNYSRTGANTSLITAVLPYGAVDETTGLRVTIESVNEGKDYIEDAEAVALRGFIIKAVTWDDVTSPLNLLRKAQEYLEANQYIINTLSLSALDLSYIDKTVESYKVGDKIRVISKPHGVDEDFMLTTRTEDLLNPANSGVTLGKDTSMLTVSDVMGDSKSFNALHKTAHQIRADYTVNIASAIQKTEEQLTSLIEQTSESIKLEVAQTYTTNDRLTEAVSSSMTQFADQFLFEFNTLRAVVDDHTTTAAEQFTEIYKYISFEGGNIKLGASDSAITLTLENDKILFKKNGAQFGWWDGVDFHTGNIVVEVNERAQFGNFAFVPRSNGSLSFLQVGG